MILSVVPQASPNVNTISTDTYGDPMVSTGVRVLFDEDVGLANYSTIADFDHDMVVFKCLGAGEDATLELRDVAENCLDNSRRHLPLTS